MATFKSGDKVRLINTETRGFRLAAKRGAQAIVRYVPREWAFEDAAINVRWVDTLAHGQVDGNYFADAFELVEDGPPNLSDCLLALCLADEIEFDEWVYGDEGASWLRAQALNRLAEFIDEQEH